MAFSPGGWPRQWVPNTFNAIQCVVPNNDSDYGSAFCPAFFMKYTGPIGDPDNDVIDND